MKIVLLDLDTLGVCDLSEIEALGELVCYPYTRPEQRLERCRDAEIIITNKVMLDEALLSNLPQLRLICISATGMNNVDLEYAQKRGIEVRNVPGYSTQAVAQHTLAIALHFLAKMSYYDTYCKDGLWCKSEVFVHLNGGLKSLEDLNWGIIGLGAIGQRVAQIVEAFGARVSYYSTSGKNTQSAYAQQDLPTLLSQSDVVSIHAPLNQNTKNLLNKTNLPLLKEESILINVGRGGIVNEEDMAEILKTKNIYFGADVLESEPMRAGHPFLDPSIRDKLLLTPHIAWAYHKARARLLRLVAQNIREFLA